MIETISSVTEKLQLERKPKTITVDTWKCPLCGEIKVDVSLDGSIVIGGEFWSSTGFEGCLDCFRMQGCQE